MSAPRAESREPLLPRLGFVHVLALGIGSVIGTGIFFVPGHAAKALGPASGLAFALGALLSLLVVLCFAEAASRFAGTGGAIVYSRAAFGDVAGFAVGWATWIARIASWGALGHAFVAAVAPLWPDAPAWGPALMLGLYVAFMVVNLRGVALGAFANTVLTAAKLVPIAVFIAIGLAHVDGARFTPFAPHGYGELGGTTVLVLYAYVGFEGMAIPAAEMKDPKRSIPLALVTSIGAIAGIYLAMWAVCTGTLPTLAGSKNPVGDAASTFLGPAAATFVQVGIVVSVLGIHAFMALVTPRALYALGHLGLAPAFLGRVSRTRAVPALAIVVTAVAVAALALSGTFAKLAVVSVLARIVQYVLTCLAVLRLRRRADAPAASLRVPFGPVLPIAAVLVCGWLVMATPVDQIVWGTIAIAAGLPLFWLARWGRR